MKGFKRVVCFILEMALALGLLCVGVGADDLEADMEQQNAVTAYALSFVGNPDLQYVWGGYGGRQREYNGERGENDGYWSLEQCIKYIDLWSGDNYTENEYGPFGTDCSGFVMAVYQHFGIQIPTDGTVSEDELIAVNKEDLLPGDLVFTTNHVMMYIGNDLVVHINTRQGYTGRDTPYDGYTSSDRSTSSVTYVHLSRIDYSTCESYARVVEDLASEYPLSDYEQSRVQDSISSMVVTEFELEGMPEASRFSMDIKIPKLPGALSNEEQVILSQIKENMDSSKVTVYDIVGAASSFVGLLLLIYGVLLILAYAFDSVNSFIDLNFVTLLTFGGVKIVRDKEQLIKTEESKKKGLASQAKFFGIVIVIIVLGALCVSGLIPKFIYWLTR